MARTIGELCRRSEGWGGRRVRFGNDRIIFAIGF